MPTARKLPSGAYRCLVFKGYEYNAGQKKRAYESFTAPTKAEAELMASEWKRHKKTRPDDITVAEAVRKCIAVKENVLSPSTVKGYMATLHRFEVIDNIRLRDLKNDTIQMWVSELSADLSPKSVKNTYGLLTATLALYAPGLTFNVKLPAKVRPDYSLPSDEDIAKLLNHVEGKPLWIAIMLARYYSLRRSEICALRSDDLVGNVLTIRRSVVQDKNKGWVVKDIPKTYSSYRSLVISEPLLSVLKQCNGNYIDCNANALMERFRRALKYSGVKKFKFHTLRHMYASKAATLGVPDIYTARMGGWKQGSSVLKEVYQNVQDAELLKQMEVMNKSMQHEMLHDNSKKRKRAAK